MTAKEHYENHLAHFYSWMIGSFEEKQKAQQDFFVSQDIKPGGNRLAIDLGAGNGLQSISLSKLGFEVVAVDFNSQLLSELKSNDATRSVEVVQDDLNSFLRQFSKKASVIVCMGDTITHLERKTDVGDLLEMIAAHLEHEGKVVISFRELTTELKGEERFISVKSDEKRILTCFLDYFPDRVIVHDLLHENQSGKWVQRVSSYPNSG